MKFYPVNFARFRHLASPRKAGWTLKTPCNAMVYCSSYWNSTRFQQASWHKKSVNWNTNLPTWTFHSLTVSHDTNMVSIIAIMSIVWPYRITPTLLWRITCASPLTFKTNICLTWEWYLSWISATHMKWDGFTIVLLHLKQATGSLEAFKRYKFAWD